MSDKFCLNLRGKQFLFKDQLLILCDMILTDISQNTLLVIFKVSPKSLQYFCLSFNHTLNQIPLTKAICLNIFPH